MDLEITVTMESDWHCGLGVGRTADLDRLVARDPDGLPYVPAKTLAGVWRDACEQLCFALDGGARGGPWSRWVDYLFGSQPALDERREDDGATPGAEAPRGAALAVRPARIGKQLRGALVGATALAEHLAFGKPGVEIDAETGRARDEHFHVDEMARAGLILHAHAELFLDGSGEEREAALQLATAAAALIERLGAKRRRGAGRCTVKVGNHAALAAALVWIQGRKDRTDLVPPEAPPDDHRGKALPQGGTGDWHSIVLRLTTETPLAVGARTVGNVVEALDFVPGTQLLAVVAGALRRTSCDAGTAIRDGDLIALPATIEIDKARGAPTPMAWGADKKGGGLARPRTVRNRMMEVRAGAQEKGLRGGWVDPGASAALPAHLAPRALLSARTHNVIDDAAQRPTENGVFTYEAIDAGWTLLAEIRVRAALAKRVKEALAAVKRLRLGRSRKDDYGDVTLQVISGSELRVDARHPAAGQAQLRVWLLSDTLLRDDALRPSPTRAALRRALECALEVSLQDAEAADGLIVAQARVRRSESWHERWGLPRPSLVAIEAGSCFAFKVTSGTLVAATCRRVEIEGIGERRAEGFGQVSLNHRFLAERVSRWVTGGRSIVRPAPSSGGAKLPVGHADHAVARVVESAAWRTALRRRVIEKADDAHARRMLFGAMAAIEPSQLANIREAAARLATPDDAPVVQQEIAAFIRHRKARIKDPKAADAKWAVAEQSLKRLLDDKEEVWRKLGWQPADGPVATADGATTLKRDLWPEAVRGLIEACIRQHARTLQ